VDDVGPLALGHKLARGILRQAIVDLFQNFLKLPGGAEPQQHLRLAAALVLGGREGDAADKKLMEFKKSRSSSMLKD
jgi:hypothetical protein